MAIDPENWLAVEQVMETKNHVLLQAEVTDSNQQQTPQLLLLSADAANGTSLPATFSVVVIIGGQRGIALVDSGSTDTFMDYSFANQSSCHIISTTSQAVKVAGGGFLDSCAITGWVSYTIQKEGF
jgi:hypothetical protein